MKMRIQVIRIDNIFWLKRLLKRKIPSTLDIRYTNRCCSYVYIFHGLLEGY